MKKLHIQASHTALTAGLQLVGDHLRAVIDLNGERELTVGTSQAFPAVERAVARAKWASIRDHMDQSLADRAASKITVGRL